MVIIPQKTKIKLFLWGMFFLSLSLSPYQKLAAIVTVMDCSLLLIRRRICSSLSHSILQFCVNSCLLFRKLLSGGSLVYCFGPLSHSSFSLSLFCPTFQRSRTSLCANLVLSPCFSRETFSSAFSTPPLPHPPFLISFIYFSFSSDRRSLYPDL